MDYISLDQLIAPRQRTEDVAVPEMGGSIQIRALSVAEQQDMRKRARVGTEIDQDRLELFLVQASLVEPELPIARVMELRQMQFSVFNRIAAAVLRLNGMTQEAAAEAEATFQT